MLLGNSADFRGRNNSRISSPELWNDMYQKRYITDEMKQELINERKLSDSVKWYMRFLNGYCYLIAVCGSHHSGIMAVDGGEKNLQLLKGIWSRGNLSK